MSWQNRYKDYMPHSHKGAGNQKIPEKPVPFMAKEWSNLNKNYFQKKRNSLLGRLLVGESKLKKIVIRMQEWERLNIQINECGERLIECEYQNMGMARERPYFTECHGNSKGRPILIFLLLPL